MIGQRIQSNVGGTAASEFGAAVTGDSTIHTKGAYAELIASLDYDVYGITVSLSGVGLTASTNNRLLADIAVGAASSEVVIIPNLMGGNSPAWNGAAGGAAVYFFPLYIAAGTRLSARCQGLVASDVVNVGVWCNQWPSGKPKGFIGQRVTAYGPNLATSSGVSVAQSTTAYAATAQITASCDNPIRYLQLGGDLLTDTTGNNKRGIVRIGVGATPDWIVSDLPFSESTTTETVNLMAVNSILSTMEFDIPAATRLALATRVSASAENRGWAIYGVD